jgi:hypothetical protein
MRARKPCFGLRRAGAAAFLAALAPPAALIPAAEAQTFSADRIGAIEEHLRHLESELQSSNARSRARRLGPDRRGM